LNDLVDDILCRPLCSVSAMVAATERTARRGRDGTAALREAIKPWLTGATPGSPAEMRLVRRIIAWGFPAPVRQYEIYDHGRFVARPDLAWPERRRGLEYDSERWHNPRRRDSDAARLERVRALGWLIEAVDGFDMRPSANRLHRLLTDWFADRAA
jgi:hypothetical protein